MAEFSHPLPEKNWLNIYLRYASIPKYIHAKMLKIKLKTCHMFFNLSEVKFFTLYLITVP